MFVPYDHIEPWRGFKKKSALGCGLYHRVIYWKMLTGELVTNDETPTVIRDNLLT